MKYGDRIVQHSLCDNVLGPYLERRLIYDNAACRVGKGTHFAMKRLTEFLRQHYKECGADGYILKCDIRKYFNSISHDVLIEKINGMKLADESMVCTGIFRWIRPLGKRKIKNKILFSLYG